MVYLRQSFPSPPKNRFTYSPTSFFKPYPKQNATVRYRLYSSFSSFQAKAHLGDSEAYSPLLTDSIKINYFVQQEIKICLCAQSIEKRDNRFLRS